MDFNRLFRRLRGSGRALLAAPRELADIKVLVGGIYSELLANRGKLDDIRQAEFRVFSQFGEDGILQYLVRRVNLPASLHTFVEFGVESYVEANTRLLLLKDNYRGLVIDGSERNIRQVQDSDAHWRHNLTALAAFIDRENINDLIRNAGFAGEIGILSVDIDGNDYWVWERLDVVDPVIVVCEYNSVFGPEHPISIPYDPGFVRSHAHYSNLYWGCSIAAWEHLAKQKGYALVGSNSAGNNAFFVRRDRLEGLREVTAKQAWVESQFRESRDHTGKLTYLNGRARLDAIRDMPVADVKSGATKKIGELQ